MIMKNGKQIGFIYKNGKKIDKIIRHGKVYFEQGFTREKTSTTLPISFDGIGKDLKDYKVYGNSYQDPYNQKNLYDFDTLVAAIYETGGATRQSHLNIDYENDTITITSWNNDSYFPGVYNGVSKIEGVNILVTPNTDYTLYYHYDRSGIEKTIIYGINESTQKYTGIFSTSPREGERSFNSGNYSEICIRFGTDHDNGNVCTISNIKLLEKSGPSPDYPNEIISCGDKTKNLFDIDEYKNAILRGGGSAVELTKINNTTLKIKNKIAQTNNFCCIPLPNSKNLLGKTVTVSLDAELFDATDTRVQMFFLTSSGVSNGIGSNVSISQNGSYTFTRTIANNFPSGADKVGLVIYGSASSQPVGSYVLWKNIQIEIGSTKTDYIPYGYRIPFSIKNENKLKLLGKTSASYGITSTLKRDGSLHISGTASASNNAQITADIHTSLPAGIYTFSIDKTLDGLIYIHTHGSVSGEYVNYGISKGNTSNTVTITEDCDSYNIRMGITKDIAYDFNLKLELVEGSTALKNFSSYIDEKVDIYLKEPLRKVGTHSDYIDFKNQKIIRNIRELLLTGVGEYWAIWDSYIYYLSDKLTNGFGYNEVLCNYFNYGNTSYTNTISYGKSNNHLNIKPTQDFINTYPTIADFKNWLLTHNLQVLGILETPIEEEADFPIISTANKNNTLNIETEITPSQVYIKYKSNN